MTSERTFLTKQSGLNPTTINERTSKLPPSLSNISLLSSAEQSDTEINNFVSHASPHHGESHHVVEGINLNKASELVEEGKSQIIEATWNQINSIIGSGIVGLPAVYGAAGLTAGVSLIIFFGILSVYTLRLLVKTAKMVKKYNYEDLAEFALGNFGYYFVSGSMLVFDFGACLSYLIILGDASASIANRFGWPGSVNDWKGPRRYSILFFSLIMFLCCLPRNISKIEKLSAVSVITVGIILCVVVAEWIDFRLLKKKYSTALPDEVVWGVKWGGVPKSIGIIAFAFVCQDSSFLILKTLFNPTLRRWTKLSTISVSSSIGMTLLFSIPGYLTFGSAIESNILTNYEDSNNIILVVRIMYVISMVLTFPVCFFVVRHVCYAIVYHGPQYKSILKTSKLRLFLITFFPYWLCIALSLYVTDLGIVMSLSGSAAAVNIAFILPPAIYFKISKHKLCFWNSENKMKEFKAIILPLLTCILGVFIAIFVTFWTIYSKAKHLDGN